MLDCIIVGGGPAGLSAALVLGRCRRSVLVCDAGRPRNSRATAVNGFLTRDRTPPQEFLETARSQLAAYPNVNLRHDEVVKAECDSEAAFRVALSTGEDFASRSLVLATGVIDELPPVAGLDELYGGSVFHCPYCDGWEWRDRRLAVYGRGESGMGLAAKLSLWSRDLILCTDGPHELAAEQTAALAQIDARIATQRIERLDGINGKLRAIHFTDGTRLERDAMFIVTRQVQASPLAARLGCEDRERRTVPTGDHQKTHVKGLYVIGDASRDVQMVIIAAAEGADAAFSINKYLLAQELPAELLD
ncbi:MAG: NAD(P)/FAD-dependent oxidoreductase [Pirellulales bacterium]